MRKRKDIQRKDSICNKGFHNKHTPKVKRVLKSKYTEWIQKVIVKIENRKYLSCVVFEMKLKKKKKKRKNKINDFHSFLGVFQCYQVFQTFCQQPHRNKSIWVILRLYIIVCNINSIVYSHSSAGLANSTFTNFFGIR